MFNLLGRLIQRVEPDWRPTYESASSPSGDLTRQLDLTEVPPNGDVRVKVVGIGGAGGNAVSRMASAGLRGVEFLAVNTDVQALRRIKGVPTLAIGPTTTSGMGSGGNPDLGRKATRESHDQVGKLLEGSEMVFVTAGMGGGTGTGAAPLIADIARRQGALTVGVVTRPFSFEGDNRAAVADRGLRQLQQKVDTLITVENDRLLSSLDGEMSLERGFRVADEVLRQGVQGISEIITVPGTINVDFADVKSIMTNGGPSFMALGEGKGRTAATDAVEAALANPLFDAPIEGAAGILFNIKGGGDLSIGQVHEVAGIIKDASKTQAQVIFGVVQDPRWQKRVQITLVATGITTPLTSEEREEHFSATDRIVPIHTIGSREPVPVGSPQTNGHQALAFPNMRKLV
jgi:cell division protein FtsZ